MSIYRRTLIGLLGEKCELCNSNENLVLHHKDVDRKNNDIQNIQLLCGVCHKKMHIGSSGRKSIAEKFYSEIQEYEEEGTWLVMYDFKSKTNRRFWANIKRLIRLVGEGSLVQYSVFRTKSKRCALALEKIARHYGADVMVFKVEEVEF